MSDVVPIAFVDESFHEHDSAGFYVLAAAVVDSDTLDQARETMRALRGARRTSSIGTRWTPRIAPVRLGQSDH